VRRTLLFLLAAAGLATAGLAVARGLDGEPDCSPSLGSFGAGRWPPACWRPYSDSSPFNRRIPPDPRLAPESPRIVARLAEWGPPQALLAGHADTDGDYFHPTYYAREGDPQFRIRCLRYACPELEGRTIRIPDPARAAGGEDAHMTVVDQQEGWEYDLWGVRSKPPGGGVLEVRSGGRTRIDGDGLGSNATAAEFGNLAGIIRAPEIEAGEIDHALFMLVRCDSGRHVWPARKSGSSCDEQGQPVAGAPPMGAHLQLDMSDAELEALRVPSWKKAILRAMARYGLFVGDTGGSSWGIEGESGSTYTSFGYDDPWVALARRAGASGYADGYALVLASAVDWERRLRVLHPCVSRETC
jgi:hypothetical protein